MTIVLCVEIMRREIAVLKFNMCFEFKLDPRALGAIKVFHFDDGQPDKLATQFKE